MSATMASGRQLFELLEEKQEPFSLDLYLLKNGCSTKRMQRIKSQGFKRKRICIGFLKSILTKLVRGKPLTFSKALSWDSKSIESGRLSVFSCFSVFGTKSHDNEPGGSSSDLSGDHQWRCMEVEDCSKQLSPVSVLEFQSSRFKRENQSKNGKNQLVLDCLREAEERLCDYNVGLCSKIKDNVIQEKVLSWQRLKGDANSLTKLLSSDMSEFMYERQFRPEVTELGVEIEAVIFEEIVHEIFALDF